MCILDVFSTSLKDDNYESKIAQNLVIEVACSVLP